MGSVGHRKNLRTWYGNMYGGTREVGEKYLGDRFVENMSCMYGIPNLLIQIKCSITNAPWKNMIID